MFYVMMWDYGHLSYDVSNNQLVIFIWDVISLSLSLSLAPALSAFLPHRWLPVLEDPLSALKSLDQLGRENIPNSQLNQERSVAEESPALKKTAQKEKEVMRLISSNSDDIPEDICKDLMNETQQLLLEKEVDTVDELHVR